MKIPFFVKKHQVAIYFVLTLAISWLGIFLLAGPSGIMGSDQISAVSPLSYIAAIAGPSVAGILMIALVDGKAGFSELRSRLGKWRFGIRWYLFALILAPVLILVILLGLSINSPVFLPVILTSNDLTTLLVSGVTMGLFVGFFEELGWTGYAIPKLRQRYSTLITGLITGLVWGAWHFPMFLASAVNSDFSPSLLLTVQLFSFLPVYRVLMVCLYEHTKSLFATILMHAPLAASQLILIPTISDASVVMFDILFAFALWSVILVIFVKNRGNFI